MLRQENNISEHRKKAYEYLKKIHHEYGHFPLLDYYPNYEAKKDRGWHFMYRSPFVHASVLDSLLNSGFEESNLLIKKAVNSLLEFREPGDLWRFWNVYEAEHPTFSDVDETSISSFALEKLGYKFKNKKILYSRIQRSGEVFTWINADWKVFRINPYVYFWLKIHNRKVMPILKNWKWITLYDAEPSIAANVVAYLGQNEKTEPIIEYVIRCWNNDRIENYQHYDRKIIFAYHVARAHNYGIESFYILNNSIKRFIIKNIDNFSFPDILLSYLSIYYFNRKDEFLDHVKQLIKNKIMKKNAIIEPYPYTTEKKNVYYGGGGCLTAAWFLEVTKDW